MRRRQPVSRLPAPLDAIAGSARVDGPVLVVVAHPDDETIGCGALLARLEQAWVVHVTDGAPRDPGHPADPQREAYAERRRMELGTALEFVSVPPERIAWLGATDQASMRELVDLARALTGWVERLSPAFVLTHAYEGGHPDHDATAYLVRAARELTARPIRVVEFASYFANGARLRTHDFLPSHSPRIDRVLSPDERRLKRRMLDAHASQAAALAPFGVAVEPFRLAPPVDFGRPPHAGPLHYEQRGWADGAEWRSLVRRASITLGVRPC